jgi:GNAT superfamily N-acetyltransferase
MTTIRPVTTIDLGLLLRLRAQAGWNQTEADLRRFLDLSPRGSFVADWNGTPAGTVCTFVFGSTAWIAMVLVEQSLRGRGIGTALMEHALAHLDGLGVERVRLDATPLGRPVYEKLGFVAEYNVLRYEGVLPMSGLRSETAVRAATPDGVRQAIRLDKRLTGADRTEFLTALYRERPTLFRVLGEDGAVEGFAVTRPGERTWQIGPCLATETGGPVLLADAFWSTHAKHVCMDVPANNPGPVAAAEAMGLSVQRTLTRMCRGPLPAERTAMIWASSGPEKG